MKITRLLLVITLLLTPILHIKAQSQSTIKGKITSVSEHKPIQYANIVIPGTTIGTMSDENGKFSLEYPDSLKNKYDLLISAIGYKRFRKPLSQLPNVTSIQLEDSLFLLEEVKTIAYNYFIPLKWENKRNKKEENLLTFAARDKQTIEIFLKIFKEYHRRLKQKTDFLYINRKVRIPNVDDKIKIIAAILPCSYCPIEGTFAFTMYIKGRKNGNLLDSKYKDTVITYFQNLLNKSMELGISMGLLTKKGRIAYYNNKPYTGKCFRYYKSGQKGITGEYVNGIKNGQWKYWYSNGQLKLLGHYKNGKKDGEWKLWYPDGKQKMLVHYKNGKLDGINIWWHPNGVKKKEAIFDNGKFISKKEWDEKGNIILKSF